GVYDVRAAKADGQASVLSAAFTVVAGGRSLFQSDLVVPSKLGRHVPATLDIDYRNAGTAARPAPLLLLTVTQDDHSGALLALDQDRLASGVFTSAQPTAFTPSIQILGSGPTPGLLQPGESIRVPVYWAGFALNAGPASSEPFLFHLNALQADDPTPI